MSEQEQPARSGPFITQVPFSRIRDDHPPLPSEDLVYTRMPSGERYPCLRGLGKYPVPPGAYGFATSVAFDEDGRPWFVVKLDSPSAPALRFSISADNFQWVFDGQKGMVFAEAEGEGELIVPGEQWTGAAVVFAAHVGEWKRRQQGG